MALNKLGLNEGDTTRQHGSYAQTVIQSYVILQSQYNPNRIITKWCWGAARRENGEESLEKSKCCGVVNGLDPPNTNMCLQATVIRSTQNQKISRQASDTACSPELSPSTGGIFRDLRSITIRWHDALCFHQFERKSSYRGLREHPST